MSLSQNRLRKRHEKLREDVLKDIERRRIAAYAQGFQDGLKVGKVFAATEFFPGVGWVSGLSRQSLESALAPASAGATGSRSGNSKKT